MKMNATVDGEPINVDAVEPAARCALLAALYAYTQGFPAIVFGKNKAILHGRDTLEGIIAANVGMNCTNVFGVDEEQFFSSDFPALLEAARDLYMKGQTSGESYRQWLVDGINTLTAAGYGEQQ